MHNKIVILFLGALLRAKKKKNDGTYFPKVDCCVH